eukprot:GABV01014264.1.p1 GENE.GABV01014264.1~~GABV01014264.1.p1  ORF type:complete len:105 (-),score=21.97 GABV01014264.1:11-325(-)
MGNEPSIRQPPPGLKIVTPGGDLRPASEAQFAVPRDEPDDDSCYLSPEVRFRPLLPPPSAASELEPTDTPAPDLCQIDSATISGLSAHLRHHFTALRRRANKNH